MIHVTATGTVGRRYGTPVRSATVPATDRTGTPRQPPVRYAGTVPATPDSYRPAVPPAGTVPAAGTVQLPRTGTTGARPASRRTARRAPDRTGTGQPPAVWTRTVPAPGTAVTRIYDGLTYYRRTPTGRWTPEGQPGPGFAWAEIPAQLRVDASRPLPAAPDGSLRAATPDVDQALRVGARRICRRRPVDAQTGLGTECDQQPAVRRRERPPLGLPEDVLALVDLSPVFSATWTGVAGCR